MKTSCLNHYEKILSVDDHIKCDEILRGFGWRFGFASAVKPDSGHPNVPFWKLPLDDEPFFNEYLFGIIEERTEKKFELLEVYCNGQTYGQDGCPHIDNVWGETHTFLFYANTDWNLTYGGQTVFLIDGKRIGIDPYPNTAILFTTDLTHYGEAYNQFCRDLRMTVCYKLKECPTVKEIV